MQLCQATRPITKFGTLTIFIVCGILSKYFGFWNGSIVPVCIGGGIGAVLLIIGFNFMPTGKVFVFDFERKVFFQTSNTSKDKDANSNAMPLSDIGGLQVIQKYVEQGAGGQPKMNDSMIYISYELNLIKNDATRINILNERDYNSLKTKAEVLAARLNAPLFDVMQQGNEN